MLDFFPQKKGYKHNPLILNYHGHFLPLFFPLLYWSLREAKGLSEPQAGSQDVCPCWTSAPPLVRVLVTALAGGHRQDLPRCQEALEVKICLLFKGAVWLAERGQPDDGCPWVPGHQEPLVFDHPALPGWGFTGWPRPWRRERSRLLHQHHSGTILLDPQSYTGVMQDAAGLPGRRYAIAGVVMWRMRFTVASITGAAPLAGGAHLPKSLIWQWPWVGVWESTEHTGGDHPSDTTS